MSELTKGPKSMFTVSSAEHLEEIYKAKKEILQLSSKLFQAIRSGEQEKAARISQKSSRIKREIREKYNVLID